MSDYVPATAASRMLGVACLIVAALAAAASGPPRPPGPYDKAIEPYVAFLKRGHAEPIDYVMGLFESHDIVILCERLHPETTQWDFIYELTSDPRFIDTVGHVFTEYVTVRLQPFIDEFLLTEGLSDAEVHDRIIHVYRNFCHNAAWHKRPFYDYLTRLYALNEALPAEKKIRLHVTDVPFMWDEMDLESYRAFAKTLDDRDRQMAQVVIDGYRALQAADPPRKKCLVVMNYRHAFQPVKWHDGGFMSNTGTFVFREFPDLTANVLINTVVDILDEDGGEESLAPTQDGKWDAAFAVLGNPDLAFDFDGSPFGSDSFDLFPYDPDIRALAYEDVFTGFLFYKPLAEHRLIFHVPGLYDEAFLAEINRRLRILGEVHNRQIAPRGPEFIERFEAGRDKDVKDDWGYVNQPLIDRWLDQ